MIASHGIQNVQTGRNSSRVYGFWGVKTRGMAWVSCSHVVSCMTRSTKYGFEPRKNVFRFWGRGDLKNLLGNTDGRSIALKGTKQHLDCQIYTLYKIVYLNRFRTKEHVRSTSFMCGTYFIVVSGFFVFITPGRRKTVLSSGRSLRRLRRVILLRVQFLFISSRVCG